MVNKTFRLAEVRYYRIGQFTSSKVRFWLGLWRFLTHRMAYAKYWVEPEFLLPPASNVYDGGDCRFSIERIW